MVPHTTKPNTSDIHCSVTPPPAGSRSIHDGYSVHTCKHTHAHMYIHTLTHELCTCIIIHTGADLGFSEGGG